LNRLTIGAGLLLLGLAACDSAPAPGDDTADTANTANTANSANSAAQANASEPAPPSPAAAPALVLEGSGIRIPSASPPRTLALGTPEAETIESLARTLGRAPTRRGENEECGGGGKMRFAEWKDDLTLWFEEGRFAGWDSKGKLETIEGVGIGSSRADVAALPGFEVEESTLGTEFRAGGLSGILSSKAADAKVTHLWGGATCVFR
jgi:hypothetical protein